MKKPFAAWFLLLAALADPIQAQILRYTGAVARSEEVPVGGAHGAAVAPDGSQLFVAAFDDNALVVWTRDLRSGALTVAQAWIDGVNGVTGMFHPVRVVVPLDGRDVYVGTFFGDAVAAFVRTADGRLRFSQALFGGADGVFGLTQVRDLVFSPDGRFLYVASYGDNAVLALRRDQESGLLTPVHSVFDLEQGGSVPGLVRPSGIAMSPDGTLLVVACSGAQSLVAFEPQVESGELRHVRTFFQSQGDVRGLVDVRAVAVSPDGLDVYAGGADGLAWFSRRGGELEYVGVLEEVAPQNLELGGASSLAFVRQGTYGFVAYPGNDALYVLRRDPNSGSLEVAEEYRSTEMEPVLGLRGASGVAVSPDGRWVYVAGQFDDAVGIFRRFVPCIGDCNEDGLVTVDELTRAVLAALGQASPTDCWQADRDGDGHVTVDEIVAAVHFALRGCTP